MRQLQRTARCVLSLSALEDRDVPATFFVDPRATAADPTFNAGRPDSHTGIFQGNPGADVFSDLATAIQAANANPGPDSIMLSFGGDPAQGGVIPIDPTQIGGSAGDPVEITDSVNFIGEGGGASILQPVGAAPGAVFAIDAPGTTVNFTGLTFYGGSQGFDASGNPIGAGADPVGVFLRYDLGAKGTISDSVFSGIYDTLFGGFAVAAVGSGTAVTVENSSFSNIGRVGVAADEGGTVSLFGNTYTGKGAGLFLDYFAQITDGSSAVISGNTVTSNQGVASSGENSAAVLVSELGGAPSNVQAFGNTFRSNTIGVAVGDNASDTSTATLKYNNIEGNLVGVSTFRVAGAAPVDATHSFWGDASGPFNPTNNSTGLGNPVSDDVLIRPLSAQAVPVLSAPTLAAYLTQTSQGNTTFAVGADAGGSPTVNIYNSDGSFKSSLTPFPLTFTGGVRTAVGDLNGDGIDDIAVGTGPGITAEVEVISGANSQVLFQVQPFDTFTGGVFVAAGDIDGDGKAELVVTPDQGGGPRVLIYEGGTFALDSSFFGITDPNFRGGARAAVGDMNGDGFADVAVAAGFGGGPRVAVFDGKTLFATGPTKLFNDIFVFDPSLRNGVYLAIGDLNGDGFGDLIAGAGPGGGPRVLALDGVDLLAGQADQSQILGNFFAGNPNNRSGVRVAVKNLDGDNRADLVVGDASGSQVTGYLGINFTGGEPAQQFGFESFPGFAGGVFVG
jgi:hypothetical protein